MKGKGEIICWDSSVMISWIKGEEDPIRMSNIQTTISYLKKGDYKLIVSVILYVEVLEAKMLEEAMEKFEKIMGRKEMIEQIAVDMRVAKKAQAIRNKTKLKTPDAIQVATAVAYKAKSFHTFDEQLLKLSGKDEVEGLAITPCIIPGVSGLLL